jgi:uncharacterized repeat protein (TIGR03803 family)
VTNTRQQSISRIRWGAVRAASTLALVLGFGLLITHPAQAQTFTVLHNFTGSSDGGSPYAGLTRDEAGNLYSTTEMGGSSNHGVVFKIDTNNTETVLYDFCSAQDCEDGEYPYAGLARPAEVKASIYGTTYGGGSGYHPYGTVFELDSSGGEIVLYSFCSVQDCADGAYPYAGLTRDEAGNLYGTTEAGGSSNLGTVFKIDNSGTETVLHNFGGSDGGSPLYARLLMDTEGNLYGVTQAGGYSNYGVVYKLSKGGTFTVLHSFAGGKKDGCYPYGVVLQDKAGDFYGTTYGCGASNLGTVFKITKGNERVLHSFAGFDGAHPYAGLSMDTKGHLYGDTYEGGASNYGTVYELSNTGVLTQLHSFSGSDGEYPYGGVIEDATGSFYGTTEVGGTHGYGTVWRIRK